MKLYGVEIPADIEIPTLDDATKAEIDDLHETFVRETRERKLRFASSPYKHIYDNMKVKPLPPDADRPRKFKVEVLRQLPPEARARILYGLRAHVTD